MDEPEDPAADPALEAACGAWIAQNLRGFTGILNLETIGGTIIEAHLRLSDQWPESPINT